jgi:flagellar basal-body rod modification protein FlgD
MSLGSVSAVSQAASLTGASLEDFLQIMVKQLQYQDPLAPQDNTQFIAQIAQFASLEQTRTLGNNMVSLLGVQSSAQSIGLLGRTVDVQTDQGALTGKVVSLDFRGSQPQLTVSFVDQSGNANGQTGNGIALSQVIGVR